MARKAKPHPLPVPQTFQRADPTALAAFDPGTKHCTMNCGPHRDDPRDNAERKFLCDDCEPNQPKEH